MKTTSLIILSVGLLSTVWSPAIGAEEPLSSDREIAKLQRLLKYDRNDNGKLDPMELRRVAKDRLLRFDKNKDGKVDQREFRLMREASRQAPARSAEERARLLERARAVERRLRREKAAERANKR